ncbi:PIG-L deacetylase family protein [Psychrobacter piechaudii]|uniref:Glucosamine-6-phosphate deaminase-like protein n=1 Tax=Psychrobacter piechaudii TaxID=1945521 RepID=A0A1R4GQF6_9GAMM|nr:PIG-L family deacetylase [Psychrobacter piechaudii]SJM70448.1 glucosamine-6-phosphate deaminase-like protein [Psychrobacter piechaudii]
MATISSDTDMSLSKSQCSHSDNKDGSKNTEHNLPIVGDRVIEGEGTSQQAWQNWQGLHDLPRLDISKDFSADLTSSEPSAVSSNSLSTIASANYKTAGQPPRVCIFAPHPDDEILGCAGLLQQLAANGNPLLLVYVTNGTQSHPDSAIYPPHKLAVIRPNESLAALEALGIKHQVTSVALNLQDGQVFEHRHLLHQKLKAIIQPNDILVTPFEHDGHPDHEATGQVVTAYAKQHSLACYQALIWAWHWAKPADNRIPWQKAVRLELTAEQLQRKVDAIHCFESQVSADDSTGNPPILSCQTIARVSQPWEVYLYES